MNVSQPDILLRTWDQYAMACKHQVKLYRINHPYTAIALPSGVYCFGCNQEHDPNKCGIVAAIISAHPQYKRVLRARQRKPMQIPVDRQPFWYRPVSPLCSTWHPERRKHHPARAPTRRVAVEAAVTAADAPKVDKLTLRLHPTTKQPHHLLIIMMPTPQQQCQTSDVLGIN